MTEKGKSTLTGWDRVSGTTNRRVRTGSYGSTVGLWRKKDRSDRPDSVVYPGSQTVTLRLLRSKGLRIGV